MDVIEKSTMKPNVYGSQGAEVTKEMALLTSFIHESLELSGINIILLNHVLPEKQDGNPTGAYEQFGSGKFLAKGGFFSTTNESITLIPEQGHRAVYLRDDEKLARTLHNSLPNKMWARNIVDDKKSKRLKDDEQYFDLKTHLDFLINSQKNVKKFAL